RRGGGRRYRSGRGRLCRRSGRGGGRLLGASRGRYRRGGTPSRATSHERQNNDGDEQWYHGFTPLGTRWASTDELPNESVRTPLRPRRRSVGSNRGGNDGALPHRRASDCRQSATRAGGEGDPKPRTRRRIRAPRAGDTRVAPGELD